MSSKAKENAAGQEDEFGKDSELANSNFFKFEEIGDAVIGVLVARETRPNRLKPGTFQEVYTLVRNDGTEVNVAGRMKVTMHGQETRIIGPMHKMALGTYLKVAYAEGKDVGQPQDAKILKVYSKGEIRQSVLDAYLGVAATLENEVAEPDL